MSEAADEEYAPPPEAVEPVQADARAGRAGPQEISAEALLDQRARLLGPQRRQARLAIHAWAVDLICLNVGFQYGINVWNRAIFDAIEQRNAPTVYFLSVVFLPLVPARKACRCTGLSSHDDPAALAFLAHHFVIGRWLANGRYYQLNLVSGDHQNPEARIAEDLRIATDPLSTSSPASSPLFCRPRPLSWSSGRSVAR